MALWVRHLQYRFFYPLLRLNILRLHVLSLVLVRSVFRIVLVGYLFQDAELDLKPCLVDLLIVDRVDVQLPVGPPPRSGPVNALLFNTV